MFFNAATAASVLLVLAQSVPSSAALINGIDVIAGPLKTACPCGEPFLGGLIKKAGDPCTCYGACPTDDPCAQTCLNSIGLTKGFCQDMKASTDGTSYCACFGPTPAPTGV